MYLEKLDAALRGDEQACLDYDWMMLELYDQTIREHWRSAMWTYLHTRPVANEMFVRQRIGPLPDLAEGVTPPQGGVQDRIIGSCRALATGLIARLERFKAVRAWSIGRYRLRGEIHQWMYDRHSLARLMTLVGFINPVQQSAVTSLIAGWTTYNLDTSSDGIVHKPDSLFMECVKPKD